MITLKQFKSKGLELKKVLNEYRVYHFTFTSSRRLVISCPTGVFTSIVFNHILSVFPLDSDVDMAFYNGNIVLERY